MYQHHRNHLGSIRASQFYASLGGAPGRHLATRAHCVQDGGGGRLGRSNRLCHIEGRLKAFTVLHSAKLYVTLIFIR